MNKRRYILGVETTFNTKQSCFYFKQFIIAFAACITMVHAEPAAVTNHGVNVVKYALQSARAAPIAKLTPPSAPLSYPSPYAAKALYAAPLSYPTPRSYPVPFAAPVRAAKAIDDYDPNPQYSYSYSVDDDQNAIINGYYLVNSDGTVQYITSSPYTYPNPSNDAPLVANDGTYSPYAIRGW
jgi:hypothetical protein